jgi:iron complex transport system substrate-binding protein
MASARTFFRQIVFAVVATAGCGGHDRGRAASGAPVQIPGLVAATVQVTDADDVVVRVPHAARRVVSLVPSATDIIVAMGGRPLLVGRTRYDRDTTVAAIPSVGGGLDPDLERLTALHPDLVVGWVGERKSLGPQIAAAGAAFYAVPTRDTQDFYTSTRAIGALLGRDSAASALIATVRDSLAAVRASVAGRGTPTVLYVIWGNPPMTAGSKTFIGQLIGVAGGKDAFGEGFTDYPNVSMEQIVRRAPDVILLSVGENKQRGAEQLRTAPGWASLPAVRAGRVVEVSADLMNRPGPHMGTAARVMRDAIHPDAH